MQAVITYFFRKGKSSVDTALKLGSNKTKLTELTEAETYEYLKPWYESVAKIGVHGIVLHDGLPADFVDEYQTEKIKFDEVQLPSGYDVYDGRFFVLNNYIKEVCIERFLATDINDVAFANDPFKWWDGIGLNKQHIIAGEEYVAFGHNEWYKAQMFALPEEYEDLMMVKYNQLYPYNVGVWGAHRETGLEVLESLTTELERIQEPYKARKRRKPSVVWDTIAFNYVLYTQYFDRVASFKMETGLDNTMYRGVTLRGHLSPLVHDRPKALKLAEPV